MNFYMLFFMLNQAKSSEILVHKFSENFGEIFYDFSENERMSINGLSSSTKLKNVLATDRGVYFPIGDATITLPPNNLSSFSGLSGYFSVIFWTFIEDYSFYLLSFKTSNGFVYLKRFSVNQNLAFRVKSVNFDSFEKTSGANSFVYGKKYLGMWNLVVFSIGPNAKLMINQGVAANVALETVFSLSQFISCNIGEKDYLTSIVGFFYYFVITDNDPGFGNYLAPGSNVCLKNACGPCLFSVKDGDRVGCLSDNRNPFQNELGNDCVNCPEGCSGSRCLICDSCGFNTCLLESDQVICKCPPGSTLISNNCKCDSGRYPSGYSCPKCLPECSTCESGSSCLSCISENTDLINSFCSCKKNFYNLTSLTFQDSCKPCANECELCDSSGLCLKCKDSQGDLSKNCECPSGYFQDKKCSKCYPECQECSSFGSCLSCISQNAVPKSFGCECNEGYGSSSTLTSFDSCSKCEEKCRTCTSTNCKTCKDSNAFPPNCECKDGFFSKNDECVPCSTDCKNCTESKCFECWDNLALPVSEVCSCGEGSFAIKKNPLVCQKCRDDCLTCSDRSTCDECLILGAVKRVVGCSCEERFYSDSVKCVKCETWNEKLKSCVFCQKDQFFFNGICQGCPDLCKTCSADGCSECVKNAKLKGNDCFCEDMFEGVSQCQPKDFKLDLMTDQLQVQLVFTVDLSKNLIKSDVKIQIPLSFDFSLKKITHRFFILEIDSSESWTSSLKGSLAFTHPIFSIFNQSLEDKKFIFLLPASSKSTTKTQVVKAFTSTTQSNFYAAFSITIFLSIINFNFVSMWNFLNSVQILVYLRLINVELPLKLDTILKALKDCTNFFNVFEYFIDSRDFSRMTGVFFQFGFETSSFFLNQGHLVSVFVMVLVNFALAVVLKKMQRFKVMQINWMKELVDDFYSSFKYSAFIRYLIQTYLDFAVNCALALMRIGVSSVNEIINLIICLLLAAFILFIPAKAAVFTNQSKEKIRSGNQKLLEEYGSLFYEFTNDSSLMTSYFYCFFFLRRILYVIILFSLTEFSKIQLVLIIFLTFLVSFTQFFVYLCIYQPYSEKLITYGNIVTEFSIMSLLVLVLVNEVSRSLINKELLDVSLTSLIYFVFFIQTLSPFMVFLKKIKKLLVEKCCKKNTEKVQDQLSDSRLQNFSYPTKRVYPWSKE